MGACGRCEQEVSKGYASLKIAFKHRSTATPRSLSEPGSLQSCKQAAVVEALHHFAVISGGAGCADSAGDIPLQPQAGKL